MKNRMSSFSKYSDRYISLEIKQEELTLSEDMLDFDNFDEKEKLINDILEEANDINLIKFCVFKLRVLSENFKNINDEGIEFSEELFDKILVILFNTDNQQIQVDNICYLFSLKYYGL